MNDRLGTPQHMLDETGTAVWEARYLPFGKARVFPKLSVVNNFRFAGQYYDSESGLHYNYHRYYDPGTRRYLTPDPIGLADGINLYSYVKNNPINFIDPYGLEQYEITRPETHPGGQQHIHWGRKNDPRGGGAINRDGSIRHGQDPPRKVKKMINKKYGWGLKSFQPLFILPWQNDYFNYLDQGHPHDLDNYYLDDDGRLVFRDNPCL